MLHTYTKYHHSNGKKNIILGKKNKDAEILKEQILFFKYVLNTFKIGTYYLLNTKAQSSTETLMTHEHLK